MIDTITGYAVRNSEAFVDSRGLQYSFINPSAHYWFTSREAAQILAKHISEYAYPGSKVVCVTITTEYYYEDQSVPIPT